MNILYVIHDFLPYTFAGSEVYTYSLAKEFQKKGHKVQVFCRNITKTEENQREIKIFRDEYDNIPVFSIYNNFTKYNNSKEYYINPLIDKIFENYITTEFKPDIIHFQHLHTLSIGMIDIAKKYKIPTVMTLHDYWSICHKIQLLKLDGTTCEGPGNGIKCLNCIQTENKIIKLFSKKTNILSKIPNNIVNASATLLKLFPSNTLNNVASIVIRPSIIKNKLNKVNNLISPSEFLRNTLIKNGINHSKISFIDNGTIYPKKIINKTFNKNNNITFGFIGTIVEYKGMHLLYEAQKLLPVKIKEKVQFYIYGDIGSSISQDYLNKYEIKENINFKIFGKFENSRIGEIHSKLDYMIIPSLWYENSPVTIHEAIIYKTPILGTDIGGITELIERHRAGKVFKFNSAVNLAKLIVSLVEKPEKFIFLPKVKTIKQNSAEIENIYLKLIKDE